MRSVFPLLFPLVFVASAEAREVITFVDGTRMEVERYEVKNNLVVLLTRDGKLFSIPASYVKRRKPEPVAPPATPPGEEEAATSSPRIAAETPSPPPEPRLPLATVASSGSPEATKGLAIDLPRPSAPLEREALVEEVLELCGTKELVFQLALEASELSGRIEQIWPGADPEVYARIAETLPRAFAEESIFSVVSASFARSTDGEPLREALDWLQSPVPRRVREAAARQSFATDEELEALAEELTLRPHASRRLEVVHRMDDALRSAETLVEMRVAILRAMMEGLDLLLPKHARGSREEISKVEGRARSEIATPLNRLALSRLLVHSQTIDDEALADYLSFWESPQGRWLNDRTFEAFKNGARVAAARMRLFLSKTDVPRVSQGPALEP